MMIWIAIAVLGLVLSVLGLLVFVGRYRRGEVSARFLLALVTGCVALAAYAAVSALRPDLGRGWPALLLLAPAFTAVIVLVRARGRTAK